MELSVERDPNTFLTEEQAARNLVVSVLRQAIEDFKTLSEQRVIVNNRVISKCFEKAKTPIGIKETDAHDLIYFFQSEELERLCKLINYKACRIRNALKIRKRESLNRS